MRKADASPVIVFFEAHRHNALNAEVRRGQMIALYADMLKHNGKPDAASYRGLSTLRRNLSEKLTLSKERVAHYSRKLGIEEYLEASQKDVSVCFRRTLLPEEALPYSGKGAAVIRIGYKDIWDKEAEIGFGPAAFWIESNKHHLRKLVLHCAEREDFRTNHAALCIVLDTFERTGKVRGDQVSLRAQKIAQRALRSVLGDEDGANLADVAATPFIQKIESIAQVLFEETGDKPKSNAALYREAAIKIGFKSEGEVAETYRKNLSDNFRKLFGRDEPKVPEEWKRWLLQVSKD